MANIHIGDTGTTVQMVARFNGKVKDISSAVTLEIKLSKPSGTVLTKTATLSTDGTDGKYEFTSIVTDFDEVGVYAAQGHVQLSTGDWHADEDSFQVDDIYVTI